jgi:hypothetical protein
MILIILKDLEDKVLYEDLLQLKAWYVNAIADEQDSLGRNYLKAIKDRCFVLCFGVQQEEHKIEPRFPHRCGENTKDFLYFFSGHLSWIRDRNILYENSGAQLPRPAFQQVQDLVQIAVGSRSDYYGNATEAQDAYEDVVDIVESAVPVSEDSYRAYEEAIAITANRFKSLQVGSSSGFTHMSVSGSSTLGFPRSKWGRIGYHNKAYGLLPDRVSLEDLRSLEGKFDYLGRTILDSSILTALNCLEEAKLLEDEDFSFRHLAYIRADIDPESIDFVSKCQAFYRWYWAQSLTSPPESLGDLCLLSMTKDVLTDVSVTPASTEEFLGIPVFSQRDLHYFLMSTLETKASIVTETSRKFRVSTVTKPWFTTITAIVCHVTRDVMSCDATLRMGFQEAHKVWKFIQTSPPVEEGNIIVSADLKEATYKMGFRIMRAHDEVFKTLTSGSIARLFLSIRMKPQRLLSPSEQTRFEYRLDPGPVLTEQGSFMGEAPSFLDLSLFNDTCSFIAECYAFHNRKIRKTYPNARMVHFPHNYRHVLRDYVRKPHSQSAGDDFIAVNVEDYFDDILKNVYRSLGAEPSKSKWGKSPYFGVFCENHFIVIPVEQQDDENVPVNCRFGVYCFLDVIKGRLLNGLAKVDSEGKQPTLGHASALNTALRWWNGPKDRVMSIFYAQNFSFLESSEGMNLHLPPNMGGYDLPLKDGDYVYPSGRPALDRYYRDINQIYRDPNDLTFLRRVILLKSIRAHHNKDVPIGPKDLIESKFFAFRDIVSREKVISALGLNEHDYKTGNRFDIFKFNKDVKDKFICCTDINQYMSRLMSCRAVLEPLPNKKPSFVPRMSKIRDNFHTAWRTLYQGGDGLPSLERGSDSEPLQCNPAELSRMITMRMAAFYVPVDKIQGLTGSRYMAVHQSPKYLTFV